MDSATSRLHNNYEHLSCYPNMHHRAGYVRNFCGQALAPEE
jgi:hypothetical protein